MHKFCRIRVLFYFKAIVAFFITLFREREFKEKLIKQFENNFARFIGIKHAIAVSSGKLALYLSLTATGAKTGDEIIVPAYTVAEVIDVIVVKGLKPIFVDICLDDGNVDVSLIEECIGSNTKYILMTHIYGCPADVDAILKISKKHNLTVIEDAAQACGAEYKGKKVGGFGKVGYFSFGIFKNLNTLGGGMIVTDDRALAESIAVQLKDFAQVSTGYLLNKALNYIVLCMVTHPLVFSLFIYPILYLLPSEKRKQINNLFLAKVVDTKQFERIKTKFAGEQAAMGLFNLKMLDCINNSKRANAKLINQHLSKFSNIRIFKKKNDLKNIYSNYVIQVKQRENIINHLFKRGIDSSAGFVICCADLDRFKNFYRDCPNSRMLENDNLYLPLYFFMNSREVSYIGNKIRECV